MTSCLCVFPGEVATAKAAATCNTIMVFVFIDNKSILLPLSPYNEVVINIFAFSNSIPGFILLI